MVNFVMRQLTFLLLLFSNLTTAQVLIKGRVVDYFERTALTNIKIENSEIKTLSDMNGNILMNVVAKGNIKLSSPGYIDLVISYSNLPDTLTCDFYMIRIEPYQLCIADGIVKHFFWKESICSEYERKMDRLWIKTRKLDRNTPLNWRINCLDGNLLIINTMGFKIQYQLRFNMKFVDYRKYSISLEKDYIFCEIKK